MWQFSQYRGWSHSARVSAVSERDSGNPWLVPTHPSHTNYRTVTYILLPYAPRAHSLEGLAHVLTLPGINPRGSWFSEPACHCILADTAVEVVSPQAFIPIARYLFPGAPGYSRNRVLHPLQEAHWPSGEYALECSILRWLLHCFLIDTVAFLQETLRLLTHRNTIQFSRYYYSILFVGRKSGNRACLRAQAFHPHG